MKRLLLSLLLLSALLPLAAQVTVHSAQLPEYYYYNCWRDIDPKLNTVIPHSFLNMYPKACGKQFYTEDSLQVYGVAVSMSTLEMVVWEYDVYDENGVPHPHIDSGTYNHNLSLMCDTSCYDQAYEYLGLYEPSGDSVRQKGQQVKLNIKTTPVTYYLDLGTKEREWMADSTPPIPFYELYFDSAVTVVDTFYIGMTCHNYDREDKCPDKPFYTWPLTWNTLSIGPGPATCQNGIFWYQYNHWVFSKMSQIFLAFPMLDTTHRYDYVDTTSHGGGDSVRIAATGLEHFVALTPNPTVTEVRVVSSVGMSRVEVYDAKGTKMGEEELAGHEGRIDVRRWPAGVYVLRVHTPLGVACKRLVVNKE